MSPFTSYINSNIFGYEIQISSKSTVNNLKPVEFNRLPTSCGVVNGEILEEMP